jgi:hypothetical protein
MSVTSANDAGELCTDKGKFYEFLPQLTGNLRVYCLITAALRGRSPACVRNCKFLTFRYQSEPARDPQVSCWDDWHASGTLNVASQRCGAASLL